MSKNNKYKNDTNLDDIVFSGDDFESSKTDLYKQELVRYLKEKKNRKKQTTSEIQKIDLSLLKSDLEKERRKKQEQIDREKRAKEYAEIIKQERIINNKLERQLILKEKQKEKLRLAEIEKQRKLNDEKQRLANEQKKKDEFAKKIKDEKEKQRLVELRKQEKLQEKKYQEELKKQEKITENKKRLIAKLKERNKNIGFNVQNEIDKNVKISQNYLFIENQLKLKKYLEELYKNGLNSDNPVEFWKKYIYSRNYKKIKGNDKNTILKKVFELARIEIMQEDLKNKNYKEYLEIRRKAGSRNNFIKLYGITGDIYKYNIDIEKEYGDIIERIIENYFNKNNYKYGLKDIYGTKEKAKEVLISLIYHESRGVFNSHNTGKKSSAFGLLQKLNANVKQFKINPFNPEESIKSFFDSIIIAFNNGISEEIIERSNIEERIQIALLVHYLGEGGTKKILNNNGGDISNIYYSKKGTALKAKLFLKETYYKA